MVLSTALFDKPAFKNLICERTSKPLPYSSSLLTIALSAKPAFKNLICESDKS